MIALLSIVEANKGAGVKMLSAASRVSEWRRRRDRVSFEVRWLWEAVWVGGR